MTRTARRRTLRLESLEGRSLMTAGNLSPEAAETIALTNKARQNPAAIAQWALNEPGIQDTLTYYGVKTSKFVSDMQAIASRPPLAWSAPLNQAAQMQSNWEATSGKQTHFGPLPPAASPATMVQPDDHIKPSGATNYALGDRINAAGYTGASGAAENTYAYSSGADNALRSFLIDWGVADYGHRVNMLQTDESAPTYNEVGVGFTKTSNPGVGPEVVTMDFGRRDGIRPYLLGFAFAQDADGYYKAGQGRGGVQVRIDQVDGHGNPTGVSQSLTTDSSGAYETQLAPGTYKVAATVNGTLVHGTTITIGSDNVEYDIKMNGAWDTPPAPPAIIPATQVVQPQTAPPASQAAPAPAVTQESPSDKGHANAMSNASQADNSRTAAAFAAPPDVVAQAIADFGDINLTALKSYDNIDFSSILGYSSQG